MATVFPIKQNTTRPKLTTTLSGFGGGATLATASSVVMRMRHTESGTVVVLGGTTAITNAALNEVTYTWVLADTAVVDEYQVEFKITWNDGGIEIVPNNAYNTVVIYDDI